MSALTKEKILARLIRREHVEPSELFGGELIIRELTRAEFRAIREAAVLPSDAPNELLDIDRWNGGIFCAGVVDGKGESLFTIDELLHMPHRRDLWVEIGRIATLILDFNEIGKDALKKTSTASLETPELTPSTDPT